MKITKSVSLASNNRGETQFITKNGKHYAKEESTVAVERAKPVLGSRAVAATAVMEKEVVVPNIIENNARNRAQETANLGSSPTGTAGAPSGTNVTDVASRNMLFGVLDGIIGMHDPKQPNITVNNIYRDMYYSDATSGSAADLYSTLPFSPFQLHGLKDEKMLDIFVSSIESMNIDTLLPKMAIDYNVLGAYVGSPAWDEATKRYVGMSSHNLDHMRFTEVPIEGIDPIIHMVVSPEFKTFMADTTAFEKYKEFLPEFLIRKINEGTNTSAGKNQGIELETEHTIFVPRTSLSRDFSGMSLYRRALPAWLYEKALIMGTIDQVYKRQRATMHVTVGETEDWVPDQDEMSTIANLFLSADLDPLGAVVVTRAGVNVNEVRRGDDFWRWDNSFDQIERIKLRGLGISETFITGDANYSTMEQALSVFMEQIRDFRNRITKEIFYDKIFPMIAHKNNITRKRYGAKSPRARELGRFGNTFTAYTEKHELFAEIAGSYPNVETARGILNLNPSDYVIPEVRWNKRLMPEADVEYVTLMQTMQELGLPIPMRGLAAAGGMNVDKIISGIEEDLEVNRIIAQYRKDLNEIKAIAGPAPGEDMGDFGEEAANYIVARQMGYGSVRPMSFGSRGNPDQPSAEFASFDSRGHRRVMTKQGRQIIADRFAKQMGAAAAEVARQENARIKASQPETLRKFYHS